MKKAFTLIELIFVMVVLAIIASVGTDILRTTFDTYANTAVIQRLESKANNAADVIASRLEQRVPMTVAAYKDGGGDLEFQPLSNDEIADAQLIFFRKDYELERKGAITGYFTNSSETDGVITLESKGSTFPSDHSLFFANDSRVLYTDIDRSDSKNIKRAFDAYYKNKQAFLNKCSGSVSFSADSVTLTRNGCSGTAPSGGAYGKYYLSKEINKFRLDLKDTQKGTLYLDILAPNDSSLGTVTKSVPVATDVADFRFTALGADPFVASEIMIKICVVEGEVDATTKHFKYMACQTRIVR